MGKLTTLEGDQDFYGSSYSPRSQSFLCADEVMLGFSIGKTIRKTAKVAKKATKAVVNAPGKTLVAVTKAPVKIAKAVGAPKSVVKAVSAATYIPRTLAKTSQKITSGITNPVLNTVFKAPEVAYNKVISPTADFAQRNPLLTAAVLGPATLIPQVMTKKGRSALFGKKSTLQKTGRFIQRHPYMTAIPTGGLSLTAALTTKRGRQALAGKKPGYRTAPGLTGSDKDEYLTLKNKKAPTAKDKARLAELSAKGKTKVAVEQAETERAAVADPSAAQSGGGGSSGGASGGASAPEVAPETEQPSSPMGAILLAAGLGAIMLL